MRISRSSSSLLIATLGAGAALAGCAAQADDSAADSSEILGTPGLAYKEPSVIWLTRQTVPGYPERTYSIGSFLLQSSADRSAGEVRQLIRSGGLGDFLVSNGGLPGCTELVQGPFNTSTRADIGPSFKAVSLSNPGTEIVYNNIDVGPASFYLDTDEIPASQVPTGSRWQLHMPAAAPYDLSKLEGRIMQMPAYAQLSAGSRQRLLNPDRTKPLLVTWNVAAFGTTVHIQANSGATPLDWQGFSCDVPNTGSFVIPASMTSTLPATGRVVVYSTRTARIPGGFASRPLDISTLAIESLGEFTAADSTATRSGDDEVAPAPQQSVLGGDDHVDTQGLTWHPRPGYCSTTIDATTKRCPQGSSCSKKGEWCVSILNTCGQSGLFYTYAKCE